ncbi:DUF1869 domain-containing protein [Siccibacter turicensis]|uniref:DUF1869 domain-containing protein n=1 Tax=Siccibacter turicensis TaxID=357233 RepID=UPI0023F09A98|nr:DUF1869 domain-containing protein [Siccibacter turicensis]MDY0970003.1 DUF1869 domain-containing protein [Siccibacter turicensis]
MDATAENKGYTLGLKNRETGQDASKVYMKPMALYVPAVAAAAVVALVDTLGRAEARYVLTVTNNNNGVSVDKEFPELADVVDETGAADAVKELINIVRGYDEDDDHNVCGW